MVALAPVSSPARLSRLNASNPLPPGCTSTSSASGPGAPVATATLHSGELVHHQRMQDVSVVASLTPCEVAGSLRPGLHGNTGQPAAAYLSAASKPGATPCATVNADERGSVTLAGS